MITDNRLVNSIVADIIEKATSIDSHKVDYITQRICEFALDAVHDSDLRSDIREILREEGINIYEPVN